MSSWSLAERITFLIYVTGCVDAQRQNRREEKKKEKVMVTEVEVHRETPTPAAPSPAFVFCLEGIAASLLLFIYFYSLITAFTHGALLIVAQSDICAALMYTNKMLWNG